MENVFKTLSGLIYTSVFLLVLGVGIIWKIYFWDSEVLNIDYKKEDILVCGVTEEMYHPYNRLNLSGKYLNKTGETLFKNNCAACHAITEVVVGPALKDITQKRERKWLQKFIQNSSGLIKNDDKEAIQIFNEFERMQMPSFELTNAEIDSILNYIEVYSGAISDIPYPVD